MTAAKTYHFSNFDFMLFSISCFYLLFSTFSFQDSEPDIVDGVGAETGQVIRTSIGGRNGQSKQV